MSSTTTNIPKKSDQNAWISGFTPQAEVWNGRLAMIGFVAALVTELASGQGILHFWNLLEVSKSVPQ